MFSGEKNLSTPPRPACILPLVSSTGPWVAAGLTRGTRWRAGLASSGWRGRGLPRQGPTVPAYRCCRPTAFGHRVRQRKAAASAVRVSSGIVSLKTALSVRPAARAPPPSTEGNSMARRFGGRGDASPRARPGAAPPGAPPRSASEPKASVRRVSEQGPPGMATHRRVPRWRSFTTRRPASSRHARRRPSSRRRCAPMSASADRPRLENRPAGTASRRWRSPCRRW